MTRVNASHKLPGNSLSGDNLFSEEGKNIVEAIREDIENVADFQILFLYVIGKHMMVLCFKFHQPSPKT